jgi:hypothetical protein
MFDWIVGVVTNWKWNSIIAIILYWTPLLFCFFGYTLRTARNYLKDKANLAKYEEDMREWLNSRAANKSGNRPSYYPTDTVGTLIGRALVSIVPIGNLWAALFDLAPEVFRRFFHWLGKFFDFPLVPGPKQK